MENNFGWTFFIERQKELFNAIGKMFQESKHKMCVRHL